MAALKSASYSQSSSLHSRRLVELRSVEWVAKGLLPMAREWNLPTISTLAKCVRSSLGFVSDLGFSVNGK